ncbi:hypothetical protein Q5P01_026251 [Channa striata]|uniref:Uncharacterized protein n=1 Tax=Channa striata TaxID=64152 RepID=A0AA88INF0_CHASR|nr:hypothetical protein Q5P01_026251 [Channa striata]
MVRDFVPSQPLSLSQAELRWAAGHPRQRPGWTGGAKADPESSSPGSREVAARLTSMLTSRSVSARSRPSRRRTSCSAERRVVCLRVCLSRPL